MEVKVVLALLFLHWVADFLLQTDWQAKNKSKNNNALLRHTAIYSLVFTIAATIYGIYTVNDFFGLSFGFITFVCHTITDYITSRINTYLYAKGDVHNFFVSVGFDQFLHFAQLLITFKLLHG